MSRNMTPEDLKALGLVLDPETGRYQKKKLKPQTQKPQKKPEGIDWIEGFGQPSYDILIPELPRFFMAGFPGKKEEKVYATAQAFYSGIHHVLRTSVKKQAKLLLRPYIAAKIGEALPPGTLMVLIFSDSRVITEKMDVDIDNKGYFWDKMLCDLLEDVSLVQRDSVFFLPTKIYHFDHEVRKNQLRILIYTP